MKGCTDPVIECQRNNNLLNEMFFWLKVVFIKTLPSLSIFICNSIMNFEYILVYYIALFNKIVKLSVN